MAHNTSFSIILPVNGARESCAEKIRKELAAEDYPQQLIEFIVIKQGLNPAHKRNTGALQAGNEYLLFLDDDIKNPAGLLNNLDRILNETQADVLGGANLGFENGNTWQRMIDIAFASKLGFGKGAVRFKRGTRVMTGNEDNLTACLLCVRKKVFFMVAGFDISLFPGEEVDLCKKLRACGCRMLYHPDIYIYHQRRKNPALLAKQIFNYGGARFNLIARHFSCADCTYLFPLFFILYVILLPLLQYCWPGFILFFLLYAIVIFALCTLKFLIKEIALQEIFFLFLTFGCIHFSYGFGVLMSLLNRIRKNIFIRN